MSNHPSYLKSLFEYYSNLSNDAVDLVGKLAQGTQGDATKISELNAEAISLWTRGLLGPWAPLLVGNPWAVPKIQFNLEAGETSGTKTYNWMGPTGITLDWSSLKRVAGSAAPSTLAKSKLTVSFANTGGLTIQLTGLPSSLTVDNVYESIVTNESTGSQVAIVVLVIVP